MERYFHPNIQSTAIKSAKLMAKTNNDINTIALLYCILNCADLATLLSYYLRYIDYLSLKRVSKYLETSCLSKLYRLDNLCQIMLSECSTGESKRLFDVANEQGAIISGSFILRLLLSTPYEMPVWFNSRPHTGQMQSNFVPSDIDLYSYIQRDDKCTACDSHMSCFSKISCVLCNGKKSPERNNVFSDITTDASREAYGNKIYLLCLRKFNVNSLIFNDLIISSDVKIHDYIRDQFDFDFCKNYYTNDVLHILNPVAILKKKCVYIIPYHLKSKSKIFETLNRKHRYEQRGFTVDVCLTRQRKEELLIYTKSCSDHKYYPHCGCYTNEELKRLEKIEVIEDLMFTINNNTQK